MATVSLCMIVKNEEAVLERCLRSVQAAVDEIVIADTGSTDRTREIARAFTDKVYDFPWIDDFSAARNFAFSKGSCDYLLWLDADDILTPEDCEALSGLKAALPADIDMVMMKYHTAFDKTGRPVFSYYRERLVRRTAGFRWVGAVHESIAPAGKIIYSDIAVTHKKEGPGEPGRNLRIYEKQLAEGVQLAPRDRFYYARELHTAGRTKEAESVLTALLEQGKGWMENLLESCRLLARCRTALGDARGALRALLWGLSFCPPRAELCCDIGGWFFNAHNYETAAFWYRTALSCRRDDRSGAFVLPDCYGYLPALQLCLCAYYQGDRAEAERWNERAATFKPEAAEVAHNRAFFARS